MAVFEVPNLFTLQGAVDAALAAGNQIHYIDLTDSPLFTHARVVIGPANPAWLQWQLIIHPKPGDPRATITSSNGSQTIFSIGPNARDVTFQDLDILRHSTNNANLIEISNGTRITFDRCRIGSNWTSVGSQGWTMLTMTYPIDILVRNCIFFSHMRGNFDRGIQAQYGDDSNSVRLYNNVIADYRSYGVDLASSHAGSLVLLRNNVIINHSDMAPEPFAYRSDVAAGVHVVSSHNVAFAAVGQVEDVVAGCQSISGEAGADFLRRARAQVDGAFVEHIWIMVPAWDPNDDFFRLVRRGSLHSEPADAGIDVTKDRLPDPRDVPVTDDIQKDPRPAGIPLHTDRGADQIREDDTLLDLSSLRLTPSVLPGCRVCTGKVVLNGIASEGGWEIKIASTNPVATVPASVTIPPGATSQTFTITTVPVTTAKTGKVTATCRGVSRSRPLTVRPIGVGSVKLSPTTVVGSKDVIGTVVLECEAAPRGIEVILKSSSIAAVVPGSFTIPTGTLSGTFPIKTEPVSAVTSVTITATANSISKSAALKIKPY